MIATNNLYDDIEHYTFKLYLLLSIYLNMPKHCCVTKCRGNYDGGEQVFRLPRKKEKKSKVDAGYSSVQYSR